MDIGVWLRELGLGRYAPAFAAGDIDAEVLTDLTETDLVQLGVSLGHRKKLLKAIAALGSSRAPTPAEASALAPRGERRHVTVLFCDLVESTRLISRLDPEDMAGIYRAYDHCCRSVVRRWEGHLAHVAGDGTLAYFGYPQAHEDDGVRAVHAGLALVQSIRELALDGVQPLRTRVGIATGLVLAGAIRTDVKGGGVVGDAVNLASRLQTLAAPGQVVVAESTRRVLGANFSLAPLGKRKLRGFEEPIEVWGVEGVRAKDRFAARSTGRLSPFAGRQDALALLERHWQRAKLGRGQVVQLCGEAGIGKSRIVHAFEERLADEHHIRLDYHCSPYYVTSAWYPVIGHIERSAGILDQDDAGTKLAKLEALLASAGADVATAAPLFAALLSIETDGRYPPLALTPQQAKARTIEALLAQLVVLTACGPVVAIVEDAHWVDPSFKELLDLTVDRIRTLPVFMLVTSRPEFKTGWAGRPHVSFAAVKRLDRKEAKAVIEGMAAPTRLAPDLVERLIDRADGVPLFLEELTRMVIEAPAAIGAPRDEHHRPHAGLGIPETLQDLLTARLDRLGPAKEVAQMGAVIGRDFEYDILKKTTGLRNASLLAAIDRLIEADLLFQQEPLGSGKYAFKHALVRDAAYDSLLRTRRQALHARLAEVLESEFPATAEVQPELLAQHYAGAGLLEQAVDGWLRAGRRAIERSELKEAVQHLALGLDQLQTLPPSPERDRRELTLHSVLGPALLVAKGYAAPEVQEAFERLGKLCRHLGDQRERFLALRGLWAFRFVRAELFAAAGLADELLALAGDEVALRLEADRAIGMTMLYRGEFERAAHHLDRGAAAYDRQLHHAHAFRFGNDPGVVCLSYAAKAHWCLGRAGEAQARSGAALRLADDLDHPFSRSQALVLAAMLAQHAGRVGDVIGLSERAIASAAEYGFPYWHAIGLILRGWARVVGSGQPAGLGEIGRGLEDYKAAGSELAVPWFLTLEAEASSHLGDLERSLVLLDEAEASSVRTGDVYYLPETWRQRGETLRLVGRDDGADRAEAAFGRARTIAGGQAAHAWALRASISLAKHLAATGRKPAARKALRSAFARHADGPELAEARHLLASLG